MNPLNIATDALREIERELSCDQSAPPTAYSQTARSIALGALHRLEGLDADHVTTDEEWIEIFTTAGAGWFIHDA